ncbi:MAG: glycine cleavage T C-terminal barrel domain-containing protein, partial [Azospirillaceae bacterium]
QEGRGMLMGTYEKAGVPWSEKTTPWDFGHELLAPDLDRIAPSLEVGFRHFPAFETAGIRQIVNGPFTFAPDGNPLIGPVRGLANYWVACGVMAGFSQGGGVGLALANWMIEGDPGFDVWGMDVARFGDWVRPAYTNAKVRENYSRRFSITFPNEELPAGRPLRQTPIHGRLQAANAVFGASFGVEHALWFAPEDAEPREDVTFRRSNAFEPVAGEVRAVREGVGLIETSNFAKYRVTGPGAEAWLDQLLVNTMPVEGRIVLAPMLNPAGRLIGDFTVARMGPEEFLVFGSGIAEQYHMRWFEARRPERGVRVEALGLGLVGLSIAGPEARELLARVVWDADVSGAAFPFMTLRRLDIGPAPCLVGRLTFTGDLGYEIWMTPDLQAAVFDRLLAAGRDLGLRLFGARALDSLRLDKDFGSWAREYRPIYTAHEAGLDRFVKLDKGDFTGRESVLRELERGPERTLVAFTVDAEAADVIGDEPIWHEGRVVGWVTSGGYAHWSRASVALGYLPRDLAVPEAGFEIEILGRRRPASLRQRPLFDPAGARMRG